MWLAGLFLVWGLALGLIYSRLESIEQTAKLTAVVEAEPGGESSEATKASQARSVEKIGRRQFLVRLGAATATITVVSGGLGVVLATAERRRLEQVLDDTMAHNTEGDGRSPFPNANDPVVPVPGTRPEYTPIKDHYKVFLQTEPTYIDGADWVLPITGLVDNPLMLTIDDFHNRWELRDQYITLSCISGRIGTSLISTTQWTGASVQDVLADAGMQELKRYRFPEEPLVTSGS